jgi:outer membrane protein assembly factor BamB
MFHPRIFQIAALGVAAWLLWIPVVRGEDWPQWRGPNRDGVWREDGVMRSLPPDGLKVAWRAAVGRGFCSPVVAKGRVYVTDVELKPPSAHERVLCFSEADGKPLWMHRYPAAYPDWAFAPSAGGPRATPIVHEGKIYTLGAMGNLFCLDAASGKVIWEKDLAREYGVKEFTGITGSPLIEGELLILYLFGKPGASVVALDRRSGKEAWRALDEEFSYSSPMVFAAGGQRQLIIWSQGAVTSLDPATGKTWWREPVRTPGDMAVATPVAREHRLLVSGLMFELQADKPAAKVLWPKSKALNPRFLSNTSTPLLQGEHVFAARTSGELVCLEASSGKELWAVDTVTGAGNGSSIHLTPNGDSVLLFTDEGNLIRARMSAAGYHELWRAHLLDGTYAFNGRNRVWPAPAYANRHVLARNDKELVCADVSATSKSSE